MVPNSTTINFLFADKGNLQSGARTYEVQCSQSFMQRLTNVGTPLTQMMTAGGNAQSIKHWVSWPSSTTFIVGSAIAQFRISSMDTAPQ
jgi:hypothetical protein